MKTQVDIAHLRKQIAKKLTSKALRFSYVTSDSNEYIKDVVRIIAHEKVFSYSVADELWLGGHTDNNSFDSMVFHAVKWNTTHKESHRKNKEISLSKRQDVRRDARYKTTTDSDVLFKLEQAAKLFKQGISMSKSARLVGVAYQFVKDYITTSKYKASSKVK